MKNTISEADLDRLDPKEYIIIKRARVNNLKNVSVAIKRNTLTVVTGLSGSGKSSLAFDTLYAEGQRMYVESLSSYARQFLGRMEKPEVDYIRGISPAIAIDQKVSTRNSRSTVGTSTEIYDYMKLLFARIGETFSPISGEKVSKDTVTDVVNHIFSYPEGTRVMVLSPLIPKDDRSMKQELELLLKKGFNRVVVGADTVQIEDLLSSGTEVEEVKILVDRAVVNLDEEGSPREDTQFRLSDSVQTAFFEGNGTCEIEIRTEEGRKIVAFSDRFERDGIQFEEPSINLFTFNNPYGACRRCEGFGSVLGLDPELVFPDKKLSVFEGAIAPWRSEKMGEFLQPLIRNGIRFDFPIHRAIKDLDPEQYQLLWDGNEYFTGLTDFFKHLEEQSYKIQYRVMLSRYRGRTVCPDCRGSRLRKDASYVKVNGKSIVDLVLLPIDELAEFFKDIQLNPYQEKVAKRILIEINNRLDFMQRVGLGYLTLNRLSKTLSGGESQRIRLATSLGSALVGSMYILDEPSIGLHPRDTERLVSVLKSLRDLGNTVIVVEHEEEVMKASDDIIDIGPDAGVNGGNLVFQGPWTTQAAPGTSHTLDFLHGHETIPTPLHRRKFLDFLSINGARENNLKNLDVKIPLGIFTVVTGVSGSGKSTLIRKILYPVLDRLVGESRSGEDPGKYDELTGSVSRISQVEMVDQDPIGKSSRSNPITYIKAYDTLRALMADQPLAKQRDYKPAHFSFNVDGGRCEACQGEGYQTIEMQFMADVKLLCESCGGKRFKKEILDVTYLDKNISDILGMSVDEALNFFRETQPKLAEKIQPLQDVGLGYIGLGQASNTLSGGEAQRVKLAYFLGKGNAEKGKTLFIFDEPTTGLHFSDIHKLLKAMNALVDQGDTVVVIEHNMEVIKCADWIIDMGPEGGEKGGFLCFEGTPEEMIQLENNHTARFLKEKMS
ncbi:excinuclease ABC, A subunit [Leadbetterella byssophila DSM 17132]|uniref:UvrABC system protein A n=1 Tax=Leadbetterella byssophila (strain DSM 17132 / JCM 16389 / KACC 11308 / NBRC 106382 / 4M15) TaxID=649349 RepID=E4RXK3_LEAB4|nr:excinuclease ABC subunit UvrA [Leadbetterella byssophila]ADQ17238.1 excinuclease ABC, A subunit [Leadbetterella byssophila DSM 17132]